MDYTTWSVNSAHNKQHGGAMIQVVLSIFLYVEQKILQLEKCLIVVSFISQVQQIVENNWKFFG